MTVLCEYQAKCWRFLYSKRFQNRPYDIPPTRLSMVLDGYGSLALLPNKGLFCSNMPIKGKEDLICPVLKNNHQTDCFEYNRQIKKEERYKDQKKFVKFPNKQIRTPIPKEWRMITARKYKFQCVYCNRYGNQRDTSGKRIRVTIDHFIPLALGGSDTIDNLVCACFDCNSAKGANMWEFGCRIDFYKDTLWNSIMQ